MSESIILAKSLLDWTKSSTTIFLDANEVDDELKSIAENRGLVLPSPDFAIFKTIYAELDAPNRNSVRLREDAVTKGLPTLVGKQINFDHNGKGHICGFILDGKLEGKYIVIYGAFFKSMFRDEFEVVKRKFEQGKLFVSFEIHKYNAKGEFVMSKLSDGTFEVNEIHFAGCGLLINDQPACPKAEVLKLLASNKALNKTETIEQKSEDLIYAELAIEDTSIAEGGDIVQEELKIEEQQKVEEVKEVAAEEKVEDKVEEAKTVVVTTENIETTRTSDTNNNGATETVEVKGEVVEETNYDDVTKVVVKEEVNNKITYTYEDMQAKEVELASVKEELLKVQDELTKAQTELKEKVYTQKDIDEIKSQAMERAQKITARRIALNDTENSIAEEDLIDDVKFENLQLKQEVAQLKTITASTKSKTDLVASAEAGQEAHSEEFSVAKVIDSFCWSKKK